MPRYRTHKGPINVEIRFRNLFFADNQYARCQEYFRSEKPDNKKTTSRKQYVIAKIALKFLNTIGRMHR